MTTQDYYLARHLKAIKKDPNQMTDFVMQLKKLNLKLEAEKEHENGREKL